MNNGTIPSLIARLEQAQEPDRELDRDIAFAIGLYARRPVVAQPLRYTDRAKFLGFVYGPDDEAIALDLAVMQLNIREADRWRLLVRKG